MKSDEQVVALIKGLTNEVNKNEGSGENVVLEAINECKREKSDFHSRLPKYLVLVWIWLIWSVWQWH